MLRARLATAAVALPSLLAVIFFAPPWGWALLVSAVAMLALAEYIWLALPTRVADRVLGLTLGAIVVVAAVSTPRPGPPLVAALALLISGGLVFVVVVREDFERGLADLGLILVGVLYVGLLTPHFFWLRELPQGPQWVTFVIAVGMAGDSCGYFVGRALGRHKLLPRVSPGKSVEGSLGILAGSVVAGAAAKAILLPGQEWGKAILLPGQEWGEVLALALALGAIGQFGDLAESVMKRTFGSKESGWIFPGHGGALDRVDSLVFPAVLLYYYLLW